MSVRNDEGQEVSFNNADESGHYSLGVSTGTYRIEVYHDDFLDKTVEEVEVTQATVLNISLEAGVVLGGKVVDEAGQPVPDTEVCTHLLTEDRWFCTETESAGSFQLRVVPAVYAVEVRPVPPFRPIRRGIVVSREGAADLVLAVSRDPAPFVPDDPPKAALISMSTPTANGEVTLTGAAGAIAPHRTVIAITLETGHFTMAQATADGSFTTTLLAPAGTSILLKVDPVGSTLAEFLPAADSDRTLLSNGERGWRPAAARGPPRHDSPGRRSSRCGHSYRWGRQDRLG